MAILQSLIAIWLIAIPLMVMGDQANYGLTVSVVTAKANGSPFSEAAFVEGNPITGEMGCRSRYRYDATNPAIVALVNASYANAERMTFTLADDHPEIRTACRVVGIQTIN